MRMLVLLLSLILSTSSFAMWIESSSPQGNEVDLNVEAIRLNFGQNINKLGGSVPVSAEHLSYLNFGKIDCTPFYDGLQGIVCRLKKPLAPNTKYEVKVLPGFAAVKAEERFSYEARMDFKTTGLSITKYEVSWNGDIPSVAMDFNLRIKPEGMTGVIQCGEREVAVKFASPKDPKGDSAYRFTANGSIKMDESCFFYFKRPLSFRDYAGSHVPDQKIIIDHSIASMQGNGGQFDFKARCSGNYQLNINLFTKRMPYLKCEFNDAVRVEIATDPSRKIKIEDFVKVTPADGVKVTFDGEIKVSNFKDANKNYVVKVLKNLPLYGGKKLSSDVIFQIETIDNPPLISPVKSVGVIEKDGPWMVGFSALNVQSMDFIYNFLTNPDDFRSLKHLYGSAEMLTREETIKIDSKINQNELVPLDVKKWAAEDNFKAGLFIGRASVKDVDPRFLDAEKTIFPDANDLKHRRHFEFGYLFTDIGLHVKKGKKGVLVWATSLKTGKPIDGALIRVLNNGGSDEKKETDKKGLAFFPDLEIKSDAEFTVVGSKDDDISFVSNQSGSWSQGISRWDFNLGGNYWQDTQRLVVDIVAERPLYLPNEKVHLKFFVRRRVPDSIELEDTEKLMKVSISDSRGNEVLSKELELNAYGTAVLEYELPVKASTGRYSVYIQQKEVTLNLDSVFQVEEFRKPEFKVLVEETAQSYDGKITYFKGGPVKNVSGEVSVIFNKRSFEPEDDSYKKFVFPQNISDYSYEYGGSSNFNELKVLSRTEMNSDANGLFKVKKTSIPASPDYGTLTVEGSFKDENGGLISGRAQTKVNPFKYIPGIHLSRWMYNTNEKINPEVIAIDQTGKHELGVKMKLRLVRVDYIYERRLGSGNYFYYDSRREEKEIASCEYMTNKDFKSCDLVASEAGYYDFVTEVVDKKLKAESTKTSSYVYKAGEFLAFEASNHDRINLNVDSTKLKLGDKLKFMAISPLQDGEALITFERDGILYSEQIPFKGNVILYEKTITDEKMIPGFFVSVVIVKGRTSDKIENQVDLGKPAFKIGYKRIEVSNFEKRLVTKVTPKLKQLEPAQMMEVTVELKDFKKRPVQGELAIAVVDDALLSLAGPYQKNYDILDTFYTLGNLGVENFQTLTQLIGRRTFGKKGANAGGGGGFEMRTDFKNTAFWAAQVETDKNGKYNFKFKVPDNLTTWKVIAVAVDKQQRFGVGENEFLVTKPLMIEPALPNFLVEGDKFQAKVVVTNRSGIEQKIDVKASSSKLEIKDKDQVINLKNDEKGSVFFPMKIHRTNSTDVSFKATGKKVVDGFKIDIPVNSNALKFAFANHGVLAQKFDIPMSIAPNAYKDTLALTVKTSTTAIEGLDEVFRYVLTYPYGCWEQQLTSAYFLVQYEAFKNVITYRFKEDKGSIKASVQKLLDKAADYQTSSGGMRYYPGGESTPDIYLSVFTAYSFVTMKKVGYKVDPTVESKLNDFLKSLLTSESNWNQTYFREVKNSTKAMILNVLAQRGEENLSQHLSKIYADRNAMDLFGLSQLAGFMLTQKDFKTETAALFDKIDSLKESSGDKISYREPIKFKEDDYKFWNYTTVRSVCSTLQTLTKRSDDKKALSSVVRKILASMNDGHWYNTQENIYCFEALRLYVEKFENKPSDPKITIAIDDKNVTTKAKASKFTSMVELGPKELNTEMKKVTLTPTPKSEVYYTSILRYETPYENRPRIKQGFDLYKTIELYDANKKTWTLLKGDLLNIRRGDTLRITLNVKVPSDRYQVLLNDQLAGCLEPVNTQLATTSLAARTMTAPTKKKYQWETPYYRGNGFEYMDLRLDAAQFYARHISKGEFTVEYLVQAIATGEFMMPESTIEEMYYPEVRATESGRKIIVNE